MALHRGIQSAIFYYISCAPCAEARHRKKRRRDADLARLEKEALEAGGSGAAYQYQHPLPSNTNPAWDLEIAIGPSKESKAAAKLKLKKEKEAEAPPRSSGSTSKSEKTKLPSTISDPEPDHQAKVLWASSFQRNYLESALPIPEKTLSRPSSRVQSPTMPAPVLTPTSSRTATSRTAASSWLSPKHPPVNDLHPSTVTRYDSPAEISWMLEPPPPARVMRGNDPERPRRSVLTSRPPTASETRSHRSNTASRPGDALQVGAQGLGLTYQGEAEDSGSDDEEHEIAAEGVEKRDSAGPAPGRDEKGDFLFPPKDWADQRRRKDSGSGYGGDDDDDDEYDQMRAIGKRDDHHRHRRPSEIRWRWSIDW
ncbi:hypothetical protein K461DRAFT_103947 [Myriangium duriaei CBS 260.36]|uniref:Uncharacterized protein n=1 Tax=Myriangium duriaei CBS 260.36 TaxID=1168546 RepID=A0A9P4J7K2_9PEZI|nr:hypothetical protein K461DRAFT_103947 [Myriangium duriaei CBS 260.36]